MNAQELAQKAARCVHFTGIQNKTCAAGCTYSRPVASVCFPSRIDGQMANPHPCQSYVPTGHEAVKQMEQSWQLLFSQTNIAREAIMADAKGQRSLYGSIACPVCKTGDLRYGIAGNGHVRAQCSTPECVSWIE